MKKLAVFVEGYTGVLFVDRLISSIADVNSIVIEQRRITGGGKSGVPYKSTIIQAAKPNTNAKYYVMIYDCGADNAVKSRIIKEHAGLTSQNYSAIIGVRDVRPTFTHADIPRLEREMKTYIKTSLIPVEIVLSIMELEAWFLAEHSHFQNIDPSITLPAIINKLSCDPSIEDMEMRLNPAEDLHNCYQIAGKSYRKQGGAKRTIEALDITTMYLWDGAKYKHLKQLCNSITSFLSP